MPHQPATPVGVICERFLPSIPARLAARRPCKAFPGEDHIVQASYGVKNIEHLLMLFEICPRRCERHRKPLELQVDPWQRFLCLQALIELDEIPRCYKAGEFREFCRQESEKLIAQFCGDDATRVVQRGSRAATSAHSTWTTPSRSHMSATTQSSRSSTSRRIRPSPYAVSASPVILGRKPLPRTKCTFYIFTIDNPAPKCVDVRTIQEPDGRSRIAWYHKDIRGVVATHFGIGKHQHLAFRYHMWDPTEGAWVPAPKSTDTLTLRPGEGRIFKHVSVQHVEGFDFYLWVALPDATRPSEPPLVSDCEPSEGRDVTPPPPSSSPGPQSSQASGHHASAADGSSRDYQRRVLQTHASGESQVKKRKGKEREVIVITDDELEDVDGCF